MFPSAGFGEKVTIQMQLASFVKKDILSLHLLSPIAMTRCHLEKESIEIELHWGLGNKDESQLRESCSDTLQH
jgi:hypothetical protein